MFQRWAMMAGPDLVPAVPEHSPPRTTSLTGVPWTGDTPTVWSADGQTVRRIPGWVALHPSGSDVAGWHRAGYNILLHHRNIRGIRFRPLSRGDLTDALALICRCLALQEAPWQGCPDGAAVVFLRTERPTLLPQRGSRGDFLGTGSLTLIHGTGSNGQRPYLPPDPIWLEPPTVGMKALEWLWANHLGGRRLIHDALTLDGFLAQAKDPLSRFIAGNGWALRYDSAGVDCRCPLCGGYGGRFTPPKGKSPAWFTCGAATCRSYQPMDFFAAMGYSDFAAIHPSAGRSNDQPCAGSCASNASCSDGASAAKPRMQRASRSSCA